MLAIARGVLDRDDNDLFRRFVDTVVDEIGIAARHEFADTPYFLPSADEGEEDEGLERSEYRAADAQGCLGITFADEIGNSAQVLRRLARKTEASSLEATERRFDLGIGCEFTAPELGEAFEDCRQVRHIDVFGLAVAPAQGEHGESDFVLTVGRQLPHSLKRLLEEFCHI